MKNSKSTKRALLSSVLAITLCLAMLIGSTYAWFTDTASTAVNSIQAGNLDVALEMKEGEDWVSAEGRTLNFVAADGRTEILWEPGCTYSLPTLRVVNNGNLALKYKVVITGIQGSAKLNEAIEWTITGAEDGKLPAGASQEITITGHMKEDAGNEYMNEKIEGIGVTVYATQDTVEKDGTGDQYDKDATYPTYPAGLTKEDFAPAQKAVDGAGNFYTSFEEAMENVADNGTLYFKEGSTVDFPTHLNVTKSVTIYGNGADFSGKDISIGTYAAPASSEVTVNIYDAKNLAVWGQPVGTRADVWNVNFYNCVNENTLFLMYRGAENGVATLNLTMTNCKATGYTDSIVHTTADGSIVIKDCTFADNCAPINIAHKQSGTMNVEIENCKFTNCGKIDPANDYFAPVRFVNNSTVGRLNVTLTNNTFAGTIGTNGDILLGDYRTGKESHVVSATIVTSVPVMVKSSADAAYSYDGGTIVIPVVEAANQDELNAAIKNDAENPIKNVAVKLAPGVNVTLDNGLANEGTNSRNVTFVGDGSQTVDVITKAVSAEGGMLNYQRGSTFTFENLTIQAGEGAFDGIVCDEVVYRNCTIKGKLTLYGKATFINCKFENTMADQYSIWTWGGTDVSFTDCVFNTNGKAILLYGQATAAKPTNLTVTRCTFNDRNSGAAGKAAIEVGNDYNATYTLTITDITVNGFAAGKNTGSTVWANKNSMDAAHLSVTIDGTKVH